VKHILTTLIWALVIALSYLLAGCAQIIIDKDKLKVNTLFKTVSFDKVIYDPNGVSEVEIYKGIPADIELVYDHLTGTWKIKTKAN